MTTSETFSFDNLPPELAHLDPNAPPVAQCDVCERKSWEPGIIGQGCFFPQPSGDRCSGTMRRVRIESQKGSRHADD